MKRLLFLCAAVVALSGCVNHIVDQIIDGETDPTLPAMLTFSYEREGAMLFTFTNASTGYVSYKWEFGDDTYSTGFHASHAYDRPGTYTVILSGTTSKGVTDKTQRVITINKPTPYIAGFTLYSIPYEDRYYRFFIKDDAVLPSSWDWSTGYTPRLYNTMLPYTITLATPHGFDNLESHSYYTIQLNRFTSTSADGSAQCLKQKIKVSEIMEYWPEYVLETETGATRIGIHMLYDY